MTRSAAAAFAAMTVMACQPVEAANPDAGTGAQPAPGDDRDGPETTITTGPPGATRELVAEIAFASETGVDFRCTLDDETIATCTSPLTIGPLGEGAHRFTVAAFDENDVFDLTPAQHTWRIDLSVTGLAVDGPPPVTNQVEVTFVFSADEPLDFRCRLDDGLEAPCGQGRDEDGTLTVNVSRPGPHTFVVVGTDALGNRAEISRQWLLDTTLPTVAIIRGPSQGTAINDRTPTFNFTVGGDPVSVTCRHDTAEPRPCTGSFETPELSDGSHTVEVIVVDAAGNRAIASRQFIVDATGPVIRVTQRPNNPSPSPTAIIAWETSEIATVTCGLDGANPLRCGSGTDGSRTLTNLSAGRHELLIVARDVHGNVTDETVIWTVIRPVVP